MATRIREKAEKIAKNKDKRPFCIVKDVRITPAKVGIVLDLVRGKKIDEAISILTNSTNASAIVIKKAIMSAAANAENNLNIPKDTLFVAECFANAGTTLKRLNPRAKGSGNIILKRTSHITVILDSVKE